MPSPPGVALPLLASPVALFISDVHLQPAASHTARAFTDFLQRHAASVQQLYLLGDLFEFWVGDDDLEAPFNAIIADALRALTDAGVQVFWIAGNRDFLVGERFLATTGLILLSDPAVVTIAGLRIVLTHGDAQCIDDVDYQAFRIQVRNPKAQQAFLSLPLAQRQATVACVRDGSRAALREKSEAITDVNLEAINDLFAHTDTEIMIHGHTHRPATHITEHGGVRYRRYVLSDWNCEYDPPRGGGLAIATDGTIRTIPHA